MIQLVHVMVFHFLSIGVCKVSHVMVPILTLASNRALRQLDVHIIEHRH